MTVFLGITLASLSGCQTFRFYGQAVTGQLRLLTGPKPVEDLLADPDTPPNLADRLRVSQETLDFAQDTLGLRVDGHYRKYLDLSRPHVVWNVQAAPEFSLVARSWWYPFVGSLDYRGYFSERIAEDYAVSLRKKGLDVFVGGVDAYSTLGWFKDPLLNTFLFMPDAHLAELLFHELAHQRVFASGDTDFNEGFATTVGEQGARAWLRSRGDTNQMAGYEQYLQRNRRFVGLVMETRRELERLYGDERDNAGTLRSRRSPDPRPVGEVRREKAAVLDALRRRYEDVKRSWQGDTGYDAWFEHPINNAKLNSVANYYELADGFEALLRNCGGDWRQFYSEAKRLAALPKAARHQRLHEWAASGETRP